MSLRVVGAGLGRTGTLSLKVALEKLLGAPCYHMAEVFAHPEHVALWHAAARGEAVDWHALFAGYRAGVDWPQGSLWPEIAEAFPDALVLLSVRDADSWWKSASETIFKAMPRAEERSPSGTRWSASCSPAASSGRPTTRAPRRPPSCATTPTCAPGSPASGCSSGARSDGWEPLCRALGVPVPDEPFPRVNTREEFLARLLAAP